VASRTDVVPAPSERVWALVLKQLHRSVDGQSCGTIHAAVCEMLRHRQGSHHLGGARWKGLAVKATVRCAQHFRWCDAS
jgi:hypothetical protein